MSGFVHLHNHSDYSLLDGACRISDYVALAGTLGMKHLGLTDHGNLFGVLHFEQACHAAGINPVVGCEVYVAADSRLKKTAGGPKHHHLVLYAKNETGYRNLMILTSKGYLEGFYYKPRIDDELLEQHHEGLMASAACLGGSIPQAILKDDWETARNIALRYHEIFGEGHFWLEVMNHGIPEEEVVRRGMRRLSDETGIPIIATNDIHFLQREHANAHDIFICIETGKKKADPNRLKSENSEFYFKSEQEMALLFPDFPDALENTVKLAEQCNLTIPQPGPLLPDYRIPDRFEGPQAFLHHLTFEGLATRYPEMTKEITERAEYELSVLDGMNYAGYFLIVWDFIDWARRHDIPVGPGRGSGAGSLVAYALRITDIDPLQYGLLFERFLNPERVSMPDFDVDFCFERRGEVIEYIHKKYGDQNVAGICTFGTLKTKAVLKDVARVLDIPFSESNAITKLVPEGNTPDGRKITVPMALKLEPRLEEFHKKGGVYKELFDVAGILEGMNRHISTHACGKVIGRSTLTDYVPLIKDQKSGDIVTAYTMDIIEPCGLVKIDILGLKTLTLLKNVERLIRLHRSDFNLKDIPEDDEATFTMLGEGGSQAVFQFEKQGMQSILKQFKPTCIEDLIALNSLNRPGPMQFIPQFIEAKNGKRTIKYPHEDLREVLGPTYGIIVYQEQVMEVARIIGGFSLGKADILRRVMSKKKVDAMTEMEADFIKGAKKQGYSEKLARDIFEMLKPFAGYGFNKSHAAAYSILAYQTAYCKANFPIEFWAANLTNEFKSTDDLKKYLTIARKEGMEILPPDVNLSEQEFTVVDGKIVYGLMGIKGMGRSAADAIVEIRTKEGRYTDFRDFVEKILDKVGAQSFNLALLETLIQIGLFNSIGTHNRATLLHNLSTLLESEKKRKKDKSSGQASLFEDSPEELAVDFAWEFKDDLSKDEFLSLEKEHLGFYFSGHPMDRFRFAWEKVSDLPLDNVEEADTKRTHTVLGMLKNIRTPITRKGQRMAFATLEDFNGSVELTFFSKTYEQYYALLQEDAVVIVSGKVDLSRDNPTIKVEKLRMAKQEKQDSEIHVELEDRDYREEDLIELRDLLQNHPGSGNLYLHVPHQNRTAIVKASPQLDLALDDQTMKRVCEYPVVTTVWKE